MINLNGLLIGAVGGAMLILLAAVGMAACDRLGRRRKATDPRPLCVIGPVGYATWVGIVAVIAHIDGHPITAQDFYAHLAIAGGSAIAGATLFFLLSQRSRAIRVEIDRQNAPDAHI